MGTCKEQWGSWERGVTHPKGKGQLRGTGGDMSGAATAMVPSGASKSSQLCPPLGQGPALRPWWEQMCSKITGLTGPQLQYSSS